ncbi:amidohydrolase family protein [Bifidobacterium sp. ESL0732]|uniref:amidohydrolase family protein n=1 Tax=Bifidobacterium sp. ESL0732 TaxID=2983222 RepID=UPI0023FA2892|nr:amidohydrolase family protein [Bifidobacterium sp. ESL0732]WEV64130.1 amidohydrolase family protein [Bifidobacterium sp. ESL0732]
MRTSYENDNSKNPEPAGKSAIFSETVTDRLTTIIPETRAQSAKPRPFIDTHVHLMKTSLYSWFNPSKPPTFEGPWDPLFAMGDFTNEQLEQETNGTPIELKGAVHIQANADDPIAEIEAVETMGERAAWPIMIVGGGDLSDPGIESLLEREAAFADVRGVRQNLNMHPHPLYNYVDKSYMDDPQWLKGLALLKKYGMSFDMQLYPTQFARACEVIDANPETLFIIDHAGMWADRDLAGWQLWSKGLRNLAQRDNCAIKISALASLDHRWTLESIKPIVYTILDAFGTDRVMFGSNFPVDKLHGTYGDIVHGFARCVETLSEPEQDALFVANAQRWYRF